VWLIVVGIPLLDPVEDMKIKGEDMTKTVQRTAVLEERLKTHSLHGDVDLESLMALADRKEQVCCVTGRAPGSLVAIHTSSIHI
jgi:ATP-dependent RNA helicase DOB1